MSFVINICNHASYFVWNLILHQVYLCLFIYLKYNNCTGVGQIRIILILEVRWWPGVTNAVVWVWNSGMHVLNVGAYLHVLLLINIDLIAKVYTF